MCGELSLGAVVFGASCPVSSTRSKRLDDRGMRKHLLVFCVSIEQFGRCCDSVCLQKYLSCDYLQFSHLRE